MKHRNLLLLLAPLVLAGCIIREQVGQDGPRPWQIPSLTIGQTREADVIAIYGQPTGRSETTVPARQGSSPPADPATDVTLTFQNGQHTVFPKTLPSTMLRTTTFRFHDGGLSGYAFVSPFPEDTRIIDFNRAEPVLHQPGMHLADLVTVIGAPQTRTSFPMLPASVSPVLATQGGSKSPQLPPPPPIGEIDTWISTVRDGATIVSRETLAVTFDREGRLLRYTRNASSTVH